MHAGSLCVKPRGSWGNGEKETIKCKVRGNPYLPESIRFGNSMSVRHLACDCPLWVPSNGLPKTCKECIEKNYGLGFKG